MFERQEERSQVGGKEDVSGQEQSLERKVIYLLDLLGNPRVDKHASVVTVCSHTASVDALQMCGLATDAARYLITISNYDTTYAAIVWRREGEFIFHICRTTMERSADSVCGI